MYRSLLLATTVAAWSQAPATIDLVCPPVQNGVDAVINRQVLLPQSFLQATTCSNIDIPASVDRTAFPLNGGVLQFDLRNSSSAEAINTDFTFGLVLSQFSNDLSPNRDSWMYLSTIVYQNASAQETRQEPLDYLMSNVAENAGNNLNLAGYSAEELDGVNATLGLRMVLFDESENVDMMFQCSYLTFVNRNISADFAGPACATPSSSTASSSPSSPSASSSNPAGSGTSSSAVPTTSSNSTTTLAGQSSSHASTIGIAVGVSVGAALVLVALGVFLLRRRRDRRGRPTVALDFFVHGREEAHGTPDEKPDMKKASVKVVGELGKKFKGWTTKKDKVKEAEAENASANSTHETESTHGSVHSEPLPVYRKEPN